MTIGSPWNIGAMLGELPDPSPEVIALSVIRDCIAVTEAAITGGPVAARAAAGEVIDPVTVVASLATLTVAVLARHGDHGPDAVRIVRDIAMRVADAIIDQATAGVAAEGVMPR